MAFVQCPPHRAAGLLTMPRSKGGMSSAPTSKVQFKAACIKPSIVQAAWSTNVGKVRLIKSGPRKPSNAVMAPLLAALADKFKR